MKTKFFLDGHYKLRLDHIQPKEAKPSNRIHLKFAMLLLPDEMKAAPTQVRKAFEIIENTELEIPSIPIATEIKGVDIEIYPTPPTAKSVPINITLVSCVLRDIRIHRLVKGEIRLHFSVGITWDRKVWKWGGDLVFMECFAKFYQSQTTLLDESEADESLQAPPDADVVALAAELNTPDLPGIETANPSRRAKSKGGRGRTLKFPPHKKGRNSHAHA
jgi:hypothetical protein